MIVLFSDFFFLDKFEINDIFKDIFSMNANHLYISGIEISYYQTFFLPVIHCYFRLA